MTVQALMSAHRRQPFEPFTIVMVNGSRYQLPYPEYLFFPKPSRTAILYVESDKLAPYKFIDIVMVSEIEMQSLPAEKQAPGDGGQDEGGGEVSAG